MFAAAFGADDGVALGDDALALGAVGGHDRQEAVPGEVDDAARAGGGHGRHVVGGVEYGMAALGYVLDDDPFDHGEILDSGDVVEPQVVAHADVGHHRHVAAVEAQALAQHAAPGGFEDGRVDARVKQHVAGAPGAAAVAAVDAPAFDDAVGAGHANPLAVPGKDIADEAGGGGLAVGAGHGHHRDAGVLPGLNIMETMASPTLRPLP